MLGKTDFADNLFVQSGIEFQPYRVNLHSPTPHICTFLRALSDIMNSPCRAFSSSRTSTYGTTNRKCPIHIELLLMVVLDLRSMKISADSMNRYYAVVLR